MIRRSVALALSRIGGDRATEALIAKLNDEESTLRGSAAEALGRIGGDRATEALIARLEDTDSGVRYVATTALVRCLPASSWWAARRPSSSALPKRHSAIPTAPRSPGDARNAYNSPRRPAQIRCARHSRTSPWGVFWTAVQGVYVGAGREGAR